MPQPYDPTRQTYTNDLHRSDYDAIGREINDAGRCTCGCGHGVGHGHHEPHCGITPERDKLESLGARLELAMLKALILEPDPDKFREAGQRVADIRNKLLPTT